MSILKADHPEAQDEVNKTIFPKKRRGKNPSKKTNPSCFASQSRVVSHLGQGQGMLGNVVHQRPPLVGRGKVDAALQDAAAVAVGGNLQSMRSRCIVHKLALLRPQALQATLDDVVAVQVADESHNAAL